MTERKPYEPHPSVAAPEEALDEVALNRLLTDLAERFEWADRADRYALAGSWTTGKAAFYRCRGEPSGVPDVVLKVGRGWTASEARALHAAMERVAVGLARDARTVTRTPTPLGWLADPPAVCMTYAEGANVARMLMDRDHEAWARTPWGPEELLAECGRALGAYHAHAGPPGGSEVTSVARAELRAAAGAMWVRRSVLERAEPALVMTSAYFDIGPHQFQVARDGGVFLLDPPDDEPVAPAQRDLARFLHGLHRSMDRGRSLGRRRRRTETQLREAFLGGYADTGPIDPREPADRWLVALYEGYDAAATARRRLGTRHVGHAVRHGWDWLASLLRIHRRRPPSR